MTASRRSRGFSLIELMVGVAIGLVLTLAIFQVLVTSEGRKRSLTGVNDVSQSGAYSVYVLDRVLRSAGTGFAQGLNRQNGPIGCRISARLPVATGETLPRTNAFPAPFTAVPRGQRLAPVVIFPDASDAGSDVIMVMSGASGYGEVLSDVQAASIGAADLRLANTIGYRANDLLMIGSNGECLLSQVSAAKTPCAGQIGAATATTVCGPLLPLAGAYFTSTGTHTSLAALNASDPAFTFTLGNPTNGNPPEFTLLGVGANSTLFRHDLLLTNGAPPASEPVSEGVRVLRAVYGIDTNADGILDAWQSPGAVGWDGATLMNGSALSNQRLGQIVAVRVGLVLRSALIEKEVQPGVPVAPANLTLFGDLPAANQITVDLNAAGENRNQRHRVIELTVPLRNILMQS